MSFKIVRHVESHDPSRFSWIVTGITQNLHVSDLLHRLACIQYNTIQYKILCNSYTMGCPPVRGDNPQAIASGLSYV